MTAPSRVAVVPMRHRHLRGVATIESATNPHPWSYDLFASELLQASSRCFAAVAPRAVVVGFGCLMTTGFETHVTTIAVAPDRQRQGIASRLLLRMLAETEALGLGDVTLEVRQGNAAALRLYEAFGFGVEGVRPGYYQQPTEDALVMWARDLGGDESRRRRRAIEAALASV